MQLIRECFTNILCDDEKNALTTKCSSANKVYIERQQVIDKNLKHFSTIKFEC